MKIVILTSTNGSVLRALVQVPFFRDRISHVLADRPCDAVRVAECAGLPARTLASTSGAEFSAKVTAFLDLSATDLIVLFYTRLITTPLLEAAAGKIINLHPSILPGCAGLDGYGDTLRCGSQLIGTTIHFVETEPDAGLPIMQSALPFDPRRSVAANRHELFLDQCRCLLQVIKWWEDGRIVVGERRVSIAQGSYAPGRYAPNIDFDLADSFRVEPLADPCRDVGDA